MNGVFVLIVTIYGDVFRIHFGFFSVCPHCRKLRVSKVKAVSEIVITLNRSLFQNKLITNCLLWHGINCFCKFFFIRAEGIVRSVISCFPVAPLNIWYSSCPFFCVKIDCFFKLRRCFITCVNIFDHTNAFACSAICCIKVCGNMVNLVKAVIVTDNSPDVLFALNRSAEKIPDKCVSIPCLRNIELCSQNTANVFLSLNFAVNRTRLYRHLYTVRCSRVAVDPACNATGIISGSLNNSAESTILYCAGS